ncbi:benzoate/H(+) symporter BenE family transporter [Catelliglobosispora koreensis]|uniref:benzoate/H(+) symporter BenE family transporter n=1 Tax=Catelliglobosispora koreensis TaxID=129052 RepID=UPI000365B017|nr:benzoate/H(+) symporter BenE family transporter [Catelliglobosispora koreensis]
MQPFLAGLVSAVVGFASSFAILLAGFRAVGASTGQAASGLLAVCFGIAVCAIFLALRYRMPIAIAWSTPGAALLAATGQVAGGWPAAVGAFAIAAALTVLAGLIPWLARGIAAIPRPVASAMLAGVLLPLCIAPVRAVADEPALAIPVVLTWAVLMRYARPWAVPGALLAAVAGIALSGAASGLSTVDIRPRFEFTMPSVTAQAVIGIAIPLFLVTMAAQNVPGMAVLSTYGYQPPLRGVLLTTGAVSAIGAPFGAHAVNLAAITAAITAGPDAHPDPSRRWIATVGQGAGQLVLGLAAGLATALMVLSPPVLVIAVAGLALLPALAAAVTAAVEVPAGREAAAVTFVITASGVAIAGIGSAFWGLVVGGLTLLLLRPRNEGRREALPSDRLPAMRRKLMWIGPLWLVAVLGYSVVRGFAGGGVAGVVAASVWALLLLAFAFAATWLARRGQIAAGMVTVIVGALLAIDVAVVVDSYMLYDALGLWRLDDGAALPYSYAPLWFPASLWPGDSFLGISQEAIRAGDFEWQEEQVAPTSFALSLLSLIFAASFLPRRDAELAAAS